MQRLSRVSRQSVTSAPISTLEHDAVAVALQDALGTRVILIRAIGEGGMGRVYLARDPQLKRFVAVKVLVQSPTADAEAHARFQREAQAIAAVSHPNVVAIYGVGELPDGRPYFIMQYVSGGSMAERLASSGPLPVEMAEGVIGDVAAALAAAHRRGIVHRDVKPANVLWDEDTERATVSDFGIATLQATDGDEQDVRITGSGMAVGSPAYMSPEQLLTEPVTPKSDIYALGLLGYELLTTRGPYVVTSPSQVVAAHLRDKPRRLSEIRTDIPESLQELLLRCLSKEPSERPSAEEVMLAMTPGAAEPLEWPPPGLERLRGALWRLMSMPAVGVVFLLAPLLLLVSIEQDFSESMVSGALLLAACSLLGFAALVRGAVRVVQLGRGLGQAARLQYGTWTIAEVISDRRGDTGSLIAGTREYGSLSPDERTRLRMLRVVRAALLFLAAPLALLVAIIVLVADGSRSASAMVFVRAVWFTLLGLGVIGVLLGGFEHFRLAKIRHRRAERPHKTNEAELAPAWYAAFDRASEGQRPGSGEPISWVRVAMAVSAGALVVAFCATVILTMSIVTVSGQLVAGVFGTGQMSYLGNLSQRSIGGTSYRTAAADSVRPLDAGEALLAVSSTGATREAPSPVERHLHWDYPRWRRVTPPGELFPKPGEMPWTSAAILAAGHGLTTPQRELLERSAAHPARDEFARAATARSADVYGALIAVPDGRVIAFRDFPLARLFSLRDAAESYAAMIALDVADHRAADAERHARDIISVGTQLLDLPFLNNNVVGFEVLDNGVSALEAVYIALGRERDARTLLDTVVATSRRRRVTLRNGVVGLQRAMHDARLVRGGRMEAVLPLMLSACADPRQLIFGVDDQHRANVRYARDSLARFPSERLWVDAIDNMLTSGTQATNEIEGGGVLVEFARLADWVVGGRRFESCAELSGQFRN
ncbi:MAG: serine/threonine-protein kinase [Gemmatimonadaceae bacterium]